MPPTYSDSTTWRVGVIALFALAVLMAAMPVRAQDPFADACPADIEATALADGSVLLEVETPSQAVVHRTHDSTTDEVVRLNGSGTYTDTSVHAGTSYTYRVALLLAGQASPPCDESHVTTRGAATANGTTIGNATNQGNATGNATGSAEGHATVDAVLEACPATIHAETRGEGRVLLRVNASSDVEAVAVYRDGGGQAVRVGQLNGSGTLVDADVDAGVAYTYHVKVIVDGRESRICDTLELAATPFFPGAAAVLAVAAMVGAYAWHRRK